MIIIILFTIVIVVDMNFCEYSNHDVCYLEFIVAFQFTKSLRMNLRRANLLHSFTHTAVADLPIYTTFNDIQYYCDSIHCYDMLLYYCNNAKFDYSPALLCGYYVYIMLQVLIFVGSNFHGFYEFLLCIFICVVFKNQTLYHENMNLQNHLNF